ncbi:hypothetical protein ACQ4PT_010888 [Festuca glaucescens]
MRSCYGRIQRIITDIIDERKAARDGSHGVCGTNEEDLLGVLLRLQLEDSLQFPLTAELVVAYKAFVLVSGSSLVDLFPSSRLVRWLSSDERRMRSCYGRIQRIITDIIDERKETRDGSHGVCGTNEEDLLGVLLRLQLEDSLQFPLTAELVVAYKAFVLVSGSSLVDLFPSSRLVRWLSSDERRMRSCYGRIQRIITDIIDERKAARDGSHGVCGTNEEDLLGVLLRLQLEDSLQFPLTAEDVFVASTDTTSAVLEWAMSELVKNPEVMAKAQLEIREVLGDHRAIITNSDLADLHYMRMIIKEVLRLHPPAALVFRKTRDDCTIMGYDILKETNVYVNVFVVYRDPRYWNNPEEFKPERFKCSTIDNHGTHFEFTPFGAGRRQCPGVLFATSTVDIVLANLLYHFDWMLPDGSSLASFDNSEKFGITISRKNDLELKAIPHM